MRPERRHLLVLLLGVVAPVAGLGYEPQVHQRLTFLAAKELNRCLQGSGVAPLTPLQVRFVANSNMGLASTNALVRFFRWSYFDVTGGNRKVLGLIDTRFLDHFEQVVGELGDTRDPDERYRALGRIVSYVQLVSSPSRAVPVYAARFWRWSFSDRFDAYRVDEQALERALGRDCSSLSELPRSYRGILHDVAADTVQAVRSPIGGLPATWKAFWQPGDRPGDFGDYGPAGNSFGRAVEFPCRPTTDEVCVLLEDDPLYLEFALERRLAAIRGTARAMFLHQVRYGRAGGAPESAQR